MYKIAVLGDRDSVLGFKALGLDTFFAEDADQARHTLQQLARPAAGGAEEYALIYITEQLASLLQEEIARYNTSVTPAIILIPGKGGSLGLGAQALQSAVERAVGADIG